MKNLKYQLTHCNLPQVFYYLRDKHKETDSKPEDVKINDIIFTYMRMIYELIEKIDIADPEDQYTLYVDLVKADDDILTDEDYIDVKIKNEKFVEPYPIGLKPWGGNEDYKNDCPDGHYNVNWYGYQEVYGITGIDRQKYLLNDIIITDAAREWILEEEFLEDCELDDYVFAEIVWELSFYGILEEKCQKIWNDIEEEIDEGEYLSWEETKEMFQDKS
jgi:hypothetical protein